MQDTNSAQTINALPTLVARGASINLLGFAVRTVLVFAHSLLAARLYGAGAYGVYAIGIAAVSLLSFLGQVGFGRTITRFVALYMTNTQLNYIARSLRVALGISLPVSVAIGLALSIGAKTMAYVFGEPMLVSYFRIFGFAVPALTLGTILAAFTQGFKQMHYKVIALDIVRPGVELLALGVLAWIGVRLSLPIAYTISFVLSAALLIYYTVLILRGVSGIKTDVGISLTNIPRRAMLKSMLSFSIPVLVVDVLMNVTRRASTLILGGLGTSVMVGIFSILDRLVTLCTTFLLSMNTMLSPVVTDLVERQQFSDLSRLFKLSTRWILSASLPLLFLIGVFGTEILRLFGPEFVKGSNALWYLIAATSFTVIIGPCGTVLMMSGHPHYSAIQEAIMLISVVTFSFLLTPKYGLLGTVWAVAIGTIVVNILRVLQVWWHLRIHPFSKALFKVIVANATFGGVLWIWRAYTMQANSMWYMLILGSGIASVGYIVVLAVLGLEKEETQILQKLWARKHSPASCCTE